MMHLIALSCIIVLYCWIYNYTQTRSVTPEYVISHGVTSSSIFYLSKSNWTCNIYLRKSKCNLPVAIIGEVSLAVNFISASKYFRVLQFHRRVN